MPPDMSGDGADVEHAPAESGACENGNGRTYEKPLRVKGTLDDVLRAAMRPKPKPSEK